jgi:hypothetical protein
MRPIDLAVIAATKSLRGARANPLPFRSYSCRPHTISSAAYLSSRSSRSKLLAHWTALTEAHSYHPASQISCTPIRRPRKRWHLRRTASWSEGTSQALYPRVICYDPGDLLAGLTMNVTPQPRPGRDRPPTDVITLAGQEHFYKLTSLKSLTFHHPLWCSAKYEPWLAIAKETEACIDSAPAAWQFSRVEVPCHYHGSVFGRMCLSVADASRPEQPRQSAAFIMSFGPPLKTHVANGPNGVQWKWPICPPLECHGRRRSAGVPSRPKRTTREGARPSTGHPFRSQRLLFAR